MLNENRTGRPARRPAPTGPRRLPPLSTLDLEPAEPALMRVVWLLNEVVKRLTRRDWRDQDKLPRTGGAVFVINHVSNLDPIVFGQFVAYAGRYPRYLGKASVFRVPVIGRIITACGQIPVERGSADAGGALAAAIQAVRSGRAVTIFPEGTITLDPDLWPMTGKTGAARVALETGAPVVPVGEWGGQDILGAKQLHLPRLFPRSIWRLKVGDPVDLDDLRSQPVTPAVLREATRRIMAAITVLVGDLRGEVPPAEPYDPRGRSSAGAGR